MRRAVVLLGLVAMLLTGCGIAGRDTPPEGWSRVACEAYDILRVSSTETDDLRFDFAMARARRWLDGLPVWDPGAVFAIYLRNSADTTIRALGTIYLTLPDREYRLLADKHVFTCPDLRPIPQPSPS